MTFSFALLTSERSWVRVDEPGLVGVNGETDNLGEARDEVEDDGVTGLPAGFFAGGGGADDLRNRNGETVEEAL